MGRLQYVDETGMCMVHRALVNGTRWLTHDAWHCKRGQRAMDDMRSLLPQLGGDAMHNRLTSYDQYPCAHVLCGAHRFRDCFSVVEHEKQPPAGCATERLFLSYGSAGPFPERPFSQEQREQTPAFPQAEHDGACSQARVLQPSISLRIPWAGHRFHWLSFPCCLGTSVVMSNQGERGV